ncbi:O-antigen translocase [Pseudomonas sp. Ant30-3]|uniref:O-antigen translocase n=1 Tax=Pseudomonas sp. Ant30-3 TaxID=1488328 RepID=UPI00048B7936|nr:O-antigen translocase [Pseudomonas sp. Ant30-3]
MNLVRTSLLNGVAVAIKMLTLLGLNKVLAVYVGPAGYAAIGQFQNALQMITTFTGGAISNGVVKYTAQYHDSPDRQLKLWRTAGTVTIASSILVGVLVALLHRQLALIFLKDENLGSVFFWFAGGVVFFSLNTLLLAILNGRKEILLYVTANIVGSLLSFGVTFYLATQYGLFGALIALVIYQSISFVVTLFLCLRVKWFSIGSLFGSLDKTTLRNLSGYFLMAVVSAACVPLGQILVRNHLGNTLGWEVAGYWEAMLRLSTAYLLLVTTTLSVYYLPRLSEMKTGGEIKAEVLDGYRLILPVAAVTGLLMYLLRDPIVSILFTSEFYPVRDLFSGQVVGDSLKICSWIMAYVMLSKAMVKLFIITEVLSCVSFYILSVIFTDTWGMAAVTWAYAANYALYSVIMYVFVYRKLDDYSDSETETQA